MSPYQKHVERWKGCQRCPLWKTRSKVVIARGKVPADVLFVGEAPGKSEDAFGVPFWGPAGILLDEIVERSILDANLRLAFGNLVGCVPVDENGKKQGEPEDASILACSPKLQELVVLCKPKLIVRVGKLASDWLTQGMKYSVKLPTGFKSVRMVDIVHPAAILRAKTAQQGLMVRRCEVVISNAIEEVFNAKG